MAMCANGHQVRVGAIFCSVCGVPFQSACGNGHTNELGSRFCETCGLSIEELGTNSFLADETPLIITSNVTDPVFTDERSFPSGASLDPESKPDRVDSDQSPVSLTLDNPPSSLVAESMINVKQTDHDRTGVTTENSMKDSSGSIETGGVSNQGRSRRKWLVPVGAVLLLIVAATVAVVLSTQQPAKPQNSITGTTGQTGSATVATLGWNSPAAIDSGQQLYSASCSSTSFCAAVDGVGNVFTFDGSSWSSADSIDSGRGLSSVSCSSTSFCAAVDGVGNVFTFDGSSWSSADSIDSGNPLNSVSCSSASYCAAVDNVGNVFTFDGSSWSSADSIDSGQQLESVSCSSASFCAAVDRAGNSIESSPSS